jgi:nucleoside-diphosphate-sugar epimerase
MRPTASEVSKLQSNNRLAAQLFSWHPLYSLDQGLQRTLDWVSANMHLFNPDVYTV